MADQKEFKHISVSDEDDDLVIEAGARRSGAHAASNPAPRAQRPAPAAEPAPSETCDDAQPAIDASAFPGVPLLPAALPGTLCVLPDRLYEGFFAARIRKWGAGRR